MPQKKWPGSSSGFFEIGDCLRASFSRLDSGASKVPGMNQAQVARPHFWVYYFPPENRPASPSFALRLVSDQGVLTVCLELSFIERSRQEETLAQQALILEVPAPQEAYYWVQDSDKQTRRMTTSESHRQESGTSL